MPKIHQAWPGTNRFCCGGITGPLKDFFANMCFYTCVLIVVIPYSIFMFQKIWNISPAIPILFFFAIALTTLFLNLTSCTDPGIIPRKPFLESNYEKYQKYLAQRVQEGSDTRKFCDTCKIYRPPRASHCSSCGNCVQVFDHHCPFVNNCIGKRNYRFFVMFLASVMLTIGAFFVNVIVFALSNTSTQIDPTVVIIICSVVVGVLAVPLLGFLIFHIYLSCTGRTTRQIIKKIDAEKEQNQWCEVDPPLIDYYQIISEQEYERIKNKLAQLNSMHTSPQYDSPLKKQQKDKMHKQSGDNSIHERFGQNVQSK